MSKLEQKLPHRKSTAKRIILLLKRICKFELLSNQMIKINLLRDPNKNKDDEKKTDV